MRSREAHRALVAVAAVLALARPAWPQDFGMGAGIPDITQYADVCVPALVTVTWDDGTPQITWDDGTLVTTLLYPPSPTIRVTWDDGTPADWDNNASDIVVFQICGPSIPATFVTWDVGTPQLLWDDNTIIIALGGYLPPLSVIKVDWDNGLRLLWDDGTLITGF